MKAGQFYGHFKEWWSAEGHDPKRAPGPKKFGAAAQARFATTKASCVVYRVMVLTEDAPGGETADHADADDTPVDHGPATAESETVYEARTAGEWNP